MSSTSRWGPLLASHQQQYQQQEHQQQQPQPQQQQFPAHSEGDASGTGRSISPVPPPPSTSRINLQNSQYQPDNGQGQEGEPYTLDLTFLKDEEPDFELTEDVEWGAETNTLNDELAPKPRPDKSDDPCGCMRVRGDPDAITCIDLSCVLFACLEECRSNCMAGDRCGNKRIQRKQWKQLEVFDAGKKGKGLKLLEDVKKGDLITEYVGRAVNRLALPRLFRQYANERKLYIMALTNDVYLDARKTGGIARYINHSCDPNCVVERWKVRGILRAAVIAFKDMPAGTELSFDYQWERKRGRAPTKCYCGADTCRGTLEVPRSMTEEALERKLSQHWKKPLIQRAGKEIINRCIKLLSRETQEYYPADVIQYDESTGQHLVMYRHDLDEVWEDLKKEDWMILDEEAEQFIIRKKTLPASNNNNNNSNTSSTSLLGGGVSGFNAPSGMMLQGLQQQQMQGMNYVYTHTPIKEALYARHLIERCQRSCRVNITLQSFSKPGLMEDAEYEERVQMLHKSPDGMAWKLTILGSDVAKARNILEKNVAYLVIKGSSDALANVGTPLGGDTAVLNGGNSVNTTSYNGNTQQSVSNSVSTVSAPEANSTEVVLPRSIVDVVKRRLPVLREKCRSVNITFVPSESKSKQFAKLIVEGALVSDVEAVKEHLWKQLNIACEENNAPKTPTGVYKDLGFLGGSMSSSDFHRLLEYDMTGVPSSSSSSSTTPTSVLNQDAKEDLTKWSPFFTSFEATQRCTVWIQADSDKGRIDGFNRIVSEATPNAPRKIYFGCDPKAVSKLWRLIEVRAAEVGRGVKYLYLGPDRLFQPQLMQNNCQFFELVKRITGATVGIDSMTGDHLRIDGEGSETLPIDLSSNVSEGERASLAEELIRLQIELYRDRCIRQESWVFGRDWALVRRSAQSNVSVESLGNASPIPNRTAFSGNTFDTRTLTNACLEIVDIVSFLELDEYLAAHAVIIMYRFTTMLAQNGGSETQLKIREILLACVFVANKAQKMSKWRRLDAVLESAYKTFYAGATFDSSKEESLVWEEKVIAAEAEILERLNYDVFTRGFNWIISAAVDSGSVDRKLAKNALVYSFSGPVLAVGPDLWLTYGTEYVFAAASTFLGATLESLCIALSLVPIKVFQAAEMIANAMKGSGFKKRHHSHPLVKEGKKGLQSSLPSIKIACANLMSRKSQGLEQSISSSETQQRYKIIGSRDRLSRVYRGVPVCVLEGSILPSVDGLCAESISNIFINKSQFDESFDLVIEGSWRAISIASFLLHEVIKSNPENDDKWLSNTMDEMLNLKQDHVTIQAKRNPGLLQMKKIDDGWSGTIQSLVSNQTSWARKIGGKCCVPGKVKETDLRQAGLKWWIPPRYGPSTSGSICSMFLGTNDAGSKEAIGNLCVASQGESSAFSMLTASATRKQPTTGINDRFVAVSLHRWPSEKVANREQEKSKKSDPKKGKKVKRVVMQVGFSPGALQEMQLLRLLHGLITSPQGHPNLYLPVGVAVPSEPENGDIDITSGGTRSNLDLKRIDEDIFSLTRSSIENEAAAQKEQKRKEMVNGPHLVFHPTPFVLQRLVGKRKRKDEIDDQQTISPTIFAAWCFDLLSAVLHCHENDIVLRTLMLDSIVVDHSGVAKLGSLYKSIVLSKEDKNAKIEDLARKRGKADDDEIVKDPYAPPEMLLGSPKHTKETDIWALGCLLSQLLLNKPVYSGKDRETILLAIYKFAGTPSNKNFESAAKFPYYKKIEGKKYVPGVVKALEKMLNEDDNNKEYASAIDLISQMLQLDPKNRITAKGALQHEYMSNYIEESSKQTFQEQFVEDWILLKTKFMKSSKSEEDEILEREKGIKRKAMLMVVSKSITTEEDDLYDMGDILEGGEAKKLKS
jgi:serine/threonine protein kinase